MAVGLVPADKPADIYKMAAEKVRVRLEEMVASDQNEHSAQNDHPEDGPTDAQLAQWWLDYGSC